MKRQQVTAAMAEDMVHTAFSYMMLIGAVWVFLRLIEYCFRLPKFFKRQNNFEKMLEEKVESYEKYMLECEEKEREEMLDQIDDEKKSLEMSKKWKERRECLDMLKSELQRVREGKDMSDWDKFLDEELKKYADMESDSNLEEVKEEEEEEGEKEGEEGKEKEKEEKSLESDVNKEKSDCQKDDEKVEIDAEPKKKK